MGSGKKVSSLKRTLKVREWDHGASKLFDFVYLIKTEQNNSHFKINEFPLNCAPTVHPSTTSICLFGVYSLKERLLLRNDLINELIAQEKKKTRERKASLERVTFRKTLIHPALPAPSEIKAENSVLC